ncbi:MAG: nitroreductase family protein [Candidatus Aenigmatarchaeota archaeon]
MKEDILEIIKTRRSIRKFKEQIPDEALIKKCIEAACYAPSSKNSQPWSFVIVRDKEKINELSKTQPYAEFLQNAPVAIVALADESKSPNHWIEDCSCAIMLLMLEAHSLGLGTCWCAVYLPNTQSREEYVRKVLDIPPSIRVVAIVGIGYPEEEPASKNVKTFRDAVLKII